MEKFKIKLDSVDPTGVAVKTEELSMGLFESESKVDRFILHVGKCGYRIDNEGRILSEIYKPFDDYKFNEHIQKQKNKKLYTIDHLVLDYKYTNRNANAGIYASPYNWNGEQIVLKSKDHDECDLFLKENFEIIAHN